LTLSDATISAVYAAWLAAEHAYSTALVDAFGDDARNRRYDADDSAHPPIVKAAWEACQRAQEVYYMARGECAKEVAANAS
tara:strand:- start:13471 stop:13713 length:243 start_codon:yes stop_codon:yes gene_type:complete